MAQLVKSVLGLPIANVKTIQGLAIANAKTILGVDNTAGGGGTSPGTTGLLAWYDFADASDADGGTFNLTANMTPSYEAGPPSYGIATDGAPGAYWNQNELDSSFGNAEGDWSLVFRFRARTGTSSNDVVLIGNGGRTRVVFNTTAINGNIGAVSSTSTVAGVLDTWFTCVLSWNNAAGEASISVNGETFVTASGTGTFNLGNFLFGAAATNNSHPVDIDFAGFWTKQLTQDNVTWLYNSDGTRTYAEL